MTLYTAPRDTAAASCGRNFLSLSPMGCAILWWGSAWVVSIGAIYADLPLGQQSRGGAINSLSTRPRASHNAEARAVPGCERALPAPSCWYPFAYVDLT